jgi:hypothetical protein
MSEQQLAPLIAASPFLAIAAIWIPALAIQAIWGDDDYVD